MSAARGYNTTGVHVGIVIAKVRHFIRGVRLILSKDDHEQLSSVANEFIFYLFRRKVK